MDIEALRRYCLQFPHTTENVQWGYDLCFKVDGKLFLVTPLEPAPVRLSFKCSPENFAELCERPGVRPAPYMARAHWVTIERWDILRARQFEDELRRANELIYAKLPKRTKTILAMPEKERNKIIRESRKRLAEKAKKD